MRHEFNTADLPAADRVDGWLEALKTYAGGPFLPVLPEAGLAGRIECETLGRLSILRLSQNSISNERRSFEVENSRNGGYAFLIQLRGFGEISQGGAQAVLGPGDTAFFDGASPFKLSYRGDNSQLSVRIPPDLVQDAGGSLRRGQALRGGLSRIASALAQATFDNASSAGEADVPTLEDALLSVVMAAVASEAEKAAAPPRLAAIEYFIHANAAANLSAGMIAGAMGMSVRQLQRVMAASGQRLSERIRCIRLEKCAAELSDPQKTGRSITQIAFECGFNDSAYFSRAFKQTFKEAPREYRRRFLAA